MGFRVTRAERPALAALLALGSACSGPKTAAPPAASPAATATVAPGRAAFEPTVPNAVPAPSPVPAGMVWIPGGEFSMGTRDPREEPEGGHEGMADAQPIHRVYVDGFWMDRTEVTNAQFAKFVAATGYRTVAERVPLAKDYPGAPPESLVAGSIVFTPPARQVALDNSYQWWRYVRGASWRQPEGPGSSVRGRDALPVVHVAWEDAAAYAAWAGKRLPTEAEFEFAARGGLSGQLYAWGNELRPNGRWMANTFQGSFPGRDEAADKHAGIAAVAQYPPNAYGLYDVAGNVWEWCQDWYRPDSYARLGAGTARNPAGPSDSFDPAEPSEKKRVQRGGSFLCTDQYCTRYMVGTRGKGEVTSGTNHAGFRCVKEGSTRRE